MIEQYRDVSFMASKICAFCKHITLTVWQYRDQEENASIKVIDYACRNWVGRRVKGF